MKLTILTPEQASGLSAGGVHRTSIEWCDYALGGLVRAREPKSGRVINMCVPVSRGCTSCYASAITSRFHPKGLVYFGRPEYAAQWARKVEWFFDEPAAGHVLGFKPRPEHGAPLYKNNRARPAVFMDDMTDLYGEWVSDEWLDRRMALCALRPDVDWLLLTKRPERMQRYRGVTNRSACIADAARVLRLRGFGSPMTDPNTLMKMGGFNLRTWPLPNIWDGVTIEDQAAADARIPTLLSIDSALHWLSIEPMLGPIDMAQAIVKRAIGRPQPGWAVIGVESNGGRVGSLGDFTSEADWTAAAIALVEQLHRAGVPAFVKQVPINGRVVHDPAMFPEPLRVRQMPGQRPIAVSP